MRHTVDYSDRWRLKTGRLKVRNHFTHHAFISRIVRMQDLIPKNAISGRATSSRPITNRRLAGWHRLSLQFVR